MNLAFAIFRYFPFGGLQRDMLALALAARARGHQVSIYCGDWQGPEPEGIRVVRVAPRGWPDIAGVSGFIRSFAECFLREEADLLVGFNKMPGLDVYFCGDGCFARKAYEERSWFYRLAPRSRLYLRNERAVFDRCGSTRVLQLTGEEQPTFMRYYGTSSRRFHTLPPGLERERLFAGNPMASRAIIRAQLAIAAEHPVLLFVGSGFRTKGLDRAIAALACLDRQGVQHCHLVVAGQDNASPFKHQAARLGLSDRVHFLGGRNDLAELYAAADLLIHPARREVAGNVLLEAMLAGLPVLTTRVCGYAALIEEQHMGKVLPADAKPEMLAEGIVSLLAVSSRHWRDWALPLRQDDFWFSRPQRALDLLESFVRQDSLEAEQQHVQSGVRQLLRDEWLEQGARQDPWQWAAGLDGQVMRELDGRRTLRFERGHQAYYCKFHRGIGWRELIKNLLNLRWPVTGARPEWECLDALPFIGIAAPHGVYFAEQLDAHPALKQSLLVTRELRGVQADDYLSGATPWQRRQVLERVTDIVRRLHGAGMNHRDLYLCHFLLDSQWQRWKSDVGTAPPPIYLMDLHRAAWRAQVPRRWLVKDLGSLYYSALLQDVSRRELLRFLRRYFARPLVEVLHEHKRLLMAISNRASRLYRRDKGTRPLMPLVNG